MRIYADDNDALQQKVRSVLDKKLALDDADVQAAESGAVNIVQEFFGLEVKSRVENRSDRSLVEIQVFAPTNVRLGYLQMWLIPYAGEALYPRGTKQVQIHIVDMNRSGLFMPSEVIPKLRTYFKSVFAPSLDVEKYLGELGYFDQGAVTQYFDQQNAPGGLKT